MEPLNRIGTHIILDMGGIDFLLLDSMKDFVSFAEGTLWDFECNVLGTQYHKFEPQGFTAVFMLSESHLSIHTWPEKGIAACDIFTCGSVRTEQIANDIVKWFSPLSYNLKKLTR
jgi:S-adenosylmethionine decarboxylase